MLMKQNNHVAKHLKIIPKIPNLAIHQVIVYIMGFLFDTINVSRPGFYANHTLIQCAMCAMVMVAIQISMQLSI